MLEQKVLARIKPSPKEEERLEKFLGKLLHVAHTVTGLECVPCGSIGKGTWLSGDHDIDLFVLFSKETTRQELERKSLDFGDKIAQSLKGKKKLKYSEHPYTQVHANGYLIDVVPCYKITKGEKIISAVDRSPLHLEFVKERLKNKDDARLLKQFCKGVGVYGSDAMHLGFSGYVCELLVIKHVSFDKVINAAASWNAPVTVSMNAPQGKFLRTPMIVIDPVDETRNAAANINEENFVKFVRACRNYAKTPSADFFFPKKKEMLGQKDVKALKGRGTLFLVLAMKKPDLLDDILYPQIRRALTRLVNVLEQNEFRVFRSYEFVTGKVHLVFELEVWSLPQIEKMVGPPLYSKQHSLEFLGKYKNNIVYLEGSRWVAEKRRAHGTALHLLKDFVRKNEEALQESGIPKNIAKVMKNCAISADIFTLCRKDKPLSAMMRDKYLSKLM